MKARPKPKKDKRTLLARLKALPERDFEHLVYDLLIISGLQNAVWRTPGADGGRDIEGDYPAVDLSEDIRLQRWYVECKRYAQSVDWPTVYEKIAYAANHDVDFLLLVTTGTLSPNCRTQLSLREQRRDRPAVRAWDGAALENIVAREPLLNLKYGFADERVHAGPSFQRLVTIASKAMQAAYGRGTVSGADFEFAVAVMELVSARCREAPHVKKRFVVARDAYSWSRIPSTLNMSSFDSYGMRAILSAVRFYGGLNVVDLGAGAEAGTCQIPLSPPIGATLTAAVRAIALWSNVEVVFAQSGLKMSLRASHG
jgi:hypothetical protein